MEPIPVEEAQRRLPELLKRAAAGERITIDDHGRVVEIVSSGRPLGQPARTSRLWELRKGLTLDDTSIRTLIEEGRE
jgi:prevent-host-death family protein